MTNIIESNIQQINPIIWVLLILGFCIFTIVFLYFLIKFNSPSPTLPTKTIDPDLFKNFSITEKTNYLVKVINSKYDPTKIDTLIQAIPSEELNTVSDQVNKQVITNNLSIDEKAQILATLRTANNNSDATDFYNYLGDSEKDSIFRLSEFYSTHNIKQSQEKPIYNAGW